MPVEDDTQSKPCDEDLEVKLGVFLCTRKNDYEENEDDKSDDDDNGDDESEDDDNDDDEIEDEENLDDKKNNFRISLLWHSKTQKLNDRSKALGCLLRRVSDFSSWLAEQEKGKKALKYEYFSSNCCRVENDVLRSYDSRFRPTARSPELYLNENCKEIVGGATIILNVRVTADRSSSDKRDRLWNVPKKRSLQVIMTPYRDGTHLATKPKPFLKIINDLEKLHELGCVHGDIRGFNIVFDEKHDGAWLIHFGFGGKAGMVQYPNGRRCDLKSRIIQKWHDWYALGCLIFDLARARTNSAIVYDT